MAARFWVNGGDALWSNTANWSLTSGGAGGQTVPTAADDVTFDSAGNVPCTLNTSARVCKTLTVASGYTNTITFDQQLSVSGSITLNPGFSFAGATTNKLRMIAAGTWTTNGVSIPQNVEIGGTTTFTATLADALTTTGTLTLTNTTSTVFSGAFNITAANITISGSQTITLTGHLITAGLTTISDANVINGAFEVRTGGLTTTGALTGTATVLFNGTGTWQGAAACSNSVTINTAGTLTLSGTVLFAASGTPTLTYTAGTISVGSSVFSIASSCTIAGAMSFFDLILTAALTLTLNSRITGTGTLTLPNAAATFTGSEGWTFANLTNTTISASRTYTFKEAVEYIITGDFTTVPSTTTTHRIVLTSAHATTKTKITLDYDATQKAMRVDPTRVDSSNGQAIYTYDGTITSSFNWSNQITSQNILNTGGGESLTVSGVTKDSSGSVLGSCDVYLFRDNGNDTPTYLGYVLSNASTGAYSFTTFAGSSFFVVAFKDGSPQVSDVTERTLTAV